MNSTDLQNLAERLAIAGDGLFTPEGLAEEQRTARETGRSVPLLAHGFAVCTPILAGEQTIGVILIGPASREVAAVAELARTISLMAAAAETNVRLIEREQHLAKTDGLTGLLNKRAILEHLRERLAPGRAGVDTQYRIDYRNDGPSAVPGVVFEDVFTIPADDTGFVMVSATRTPGTVACAVTPGPGAPSTPSGSPSPSAA